MYGRIKTEMYVKSEDTKPQFQRQYVSISQNITCVPCNVVGGNLNS